MTRRKPAQEEEFAVPDPSAPPIVLEPDYLVRAELQRALTRRAEELEAGNYAEWIDTPTPGDDPAAWAEADLEADTAAGELVNLPPDWGSDRARPDDGGALVLDAEWLAKRDAGILEERERLREFRRLGLPVDLPEVALPPEQKDALRAEGQGAYADSVADEIKPDEARRRLGMTAKMFKQAWQAFYRVTTAFGAGGIDGMAALEDPGPITYLATGDGRPYLAVLRDPWEVVELTEDGPYGAYVQAAIRANGGAIALFLDWSRAGHPGAQKAELDQVLAEATKARAALLEELRRQRRPDKPPEAIGRWQTLAPIAPVSPPKRGRRLAEALPQPTFIEARELSRAYANAPSLRYWSSLPGETAMLHTSPGAAHTAKLAFTSDLAAWWGLTPSTDALQALLQRFGPDGYLAVHMVVGLSLEAERVTVTLDDLILAIGWLPRSEKQRREMRREWWLYLTTMASTAMIGARAGHEKYRDQRTGKEIDTVIRSPLVVILGDEKAAQLSIDASEPPLSVTLTAGIFTAAHRGNQQVLSEHGDLLRLAQIPAGKAAGKWARSIGVALHQKWRERGKETRADRYEFTRRELLDLYRVEPYYDALAVTEPKRVVTYWHDALGLLERQAVIGKREEPALPNMRKGLVEAFLDQRVTIWPPASLLPAATSIQERAQAVSRRRGRPRKAKNRPD